MSFKQKLLERILHTMQSNKISQVDIANKMGVTRQAINIWLRTDTVSLEKLMEIADAIGIKISVEFGGEQP